MARPNDQARLRRPACKGLTPRRTRMAGRRSFSAFVDVRPVHPLPCADDPGWCPTPKLSRREAMLQRQVRPP